MDTLHTVLRSINGANPGKSKTETKSRRDHLDVFREFLDHLGRAARRKATPRAVKAKRKSQRRR
jgi:hypothetical protein